VGGNIMKNILIMNTGTGWGGLEAWFYKTAAALQQRDYNIFILAKTDSKFHHKSIEQRFNVTGIDHIGDGTFLNPVRIGFLVKYLKKNKIDAIFLAQSSHFKYGSVAGKLAGTEKIIYRRAIAKPIKNKFYNRLFLKCFITDFMSISKITRDMNLQDIPAGVLDKSKQKLVYKGVKKDNFLEPEIKFDLRDEFEIKKDELILVNIGRMCRQKAQQYLIEALPKVIEKHQNFKVLFVGKLGGKENKYKKLAEELGVKDNVIFTGFRKDIPSILKQADFMVHTAIYEGGSPWVILEAMMAGLPIVSTEAITIPEFVQDGVNGYLAENKNPEDIANQVIKMIENKDRVKMGQKSAEIAAEKYTFKKMIDNIEEKIFNKTLN
jgi:glycosyltransferase involved in cell wall biosynthesis